MGNWMYPKDEHFRMPAEWQAHQRTLLSWPVRESMCHPEDYERVCRGYAGFAAAVSEFEPVAVLVNPQDMRRAKELLEGHTAGFLEIAHNDAWLRDNGPTFLADGNGNVAGVNWKFNAWGEKYAPWDLDDQVAPRILEYYGMKRYDAPFVLEGGSIHTDGEGTLLTTEECLLNKNRNPGLAKEQLEASLKRYLNIEKVIWLKKGLDGDETDGHVDNIACFAAPGKVLMQVCEDPGDDNYAVTQENLEILRHAADARGRRLEVIPVRQPPRSDYKGKRLTLSYLNFYFVNGGILLPIFGGAAAQTDRMAEEVLRRTFAGRKIRAVDGMAVVTEGGNIHCTTQQMPAPWRAAGQEKG